MAEIIKTYTEILPECRFMGIRYGEEDSINGGFAHLWEDWFKNKRFEALEHAQNASGTGSIPEAGSYIGLMRSGEGIAFEYWIGMFFAPETPEAEGFEALDFGMLPLGVCWVKGKEPEIYHQCGSCLEQLAALGHFPAEDEEGGRWIMERYTCSRFLPADEQGNRILDIAVMLQEVTSDEDNSGHPNLYCARCRRVSKERTCRVCGRGTQQPEEDDPVYMGELPALLRNHLQIAFQATEIPFTALPTLGSGFTLSAGEIFETYKVFVPYARHREARAAFLRVMARYHGPEQEQQLPEEQ